LGGGLDAAGSTPPIEARQTKQPLGEIPRRSKSMTLLPSLIADDALDASIDDVVANAATRFGRTAAVLQ
jgi:hypothetical protein